MVFVFQEELFQDVCLQDLALIWVHEGSLCPGKFTYSPLRLPGGRDLWEVAMVTPFICILPTLACLLPALLSVCII